LFIFLLPAPVKYAALVFSKELNKAGPGKINGKINGTFVQNVHNLNPVWIPLCHRRTRNNTDKKITLFVGGGLLFVVGCCIYFQL